MKLLYFEDFNYTFLRIPFLEVTLIQPWYGEFNLWIFSLNHCLKRS